MSECPKNCASCASAAGCADKTPADPWLEKIDAMVTEFHHEGNFCCSQTVLAIGMRRLGVDDPDLLRTMAAFCGGKCGGTCGALVGGAALLGLYLGWGRPEQEREARLREYSAELTKQFHDYWHATDCEGLVHNDPELRAYTCPSLIAGTVEMAWGILHKNGISLDTREVQ